MDGENNGKPYEQMDDLGVIFYFWKHPVPPKAPPQKNKALLRDY